MHRGGASSGTGASHKQNIFASQRADLKIQYLDAYPQHKLVVPHYLTFADVFFLIVASVCVLLIIFAGELELFLMAFVTYPASVDIAIA